MLRCRAANPRRRLDASSLATADWHVTRERPSYESVLPLLPRARDHLLGSLLRAIKDFASPSEFRHVRRHRIEGRGGGAVRLALFGGRRLRTTAKQFLPEAHKSPSRIFTADISEKVTTDAKASLNAYALVRAKFVPRRVKRAPAVRPAPPPPPPRHKSPRSSTAAAAGSRHTPRLPSSPPKTCPPGRARFAAA